MIQVIQIRLLGDPPLRLRIGYYMQPRNKKFITVVVCKTRSFFYNSNGDIVYDYALRKFREL